MSIIREGFYFAGVALLIALIFGVLIHPYAAILPAVVACYCIYFFRNPNRTIPADENLIVSPADGTVQDVVELDGDDFVKGACRKVIIFLSVFDVHVNRSPIAGEIKISAEDFVPLTKIRSASKMNGTLSALKTNGSA